MDVSRPVLCSLLNRALIKKMPKAAVHDLLFCIVGCGLMKRVLHSVSLRKGLNAIMMGFNGKNTLEIQ